MGIQAHKVLLAPWDKEAAVLQDTTSGLCFGPLFGSRQEADDFVEWYDANHNTALQGIAPRDVADKRREWQKLMQDEFDISGYDARFVWEQDSKIPHALVALCDTEGTNAPGTRFRTDGSVGAEWIPNYRILPEGNGTYVLQDHDSKIGYTRIAGGLSLEDAKYKANQHSIWEGTYPGWEWVNT